MRHNPILFSLFSRAFLIVLTISATCFSEEPGAPITLAQCYEWAKDRSESLKIKAEDIKQSEARGRAALGGALPEIAWKWSETWQQPSGVDRLEAKGFSGFVEKDQVESRFFASQPLFSGLREYNAWTGFKHEQARNTLQLERAHHELFEHTSNVFYLVIGFESLRMNTQGTYTLAEDRVKELTRFLKLGKARDSEIYTAKAHAAALKADLDRIRANIVSSREELTFLTGKDLTSVPLQDAIPNPPVFGNLESALDRSANRSDVRAQEEELEAMKRRIRYEKGFHWPSADISGNYYTKRATFLKDIDWDVLLSVDVPIYQGGSVSARVREMISAYQQSLLEKQLLERHITYTIRKTYGELTIAIQEVQSLEEATRAARQSYNLLLEEYRLGLVTNLDVLQALDLLQSQQNSRDAALIRTKRLFIQLNVAVEGEISS